MITSRSASGYAVLFILCQMLSASAVAQTTEAILHTTAGDMKCELWPDKAPRAVSNFIGLATGTKTWLNPTSNKIERHTPLYDGVTFHRVIPDFMIQGGDPSGTGSGQVGFNFEDRCTISSFDRPGLMAMANRGPNTNSSQFFITEKETSSISGKDFTIFGQCDNDAVNLVKHIARMPRGDKDRPYRPVTIQHVEIINPPPPLTAEGACRLGQQDDLTKLSFPDVEYVLVSRDLLACTKDAAAKVWASIQDQQKKGTKTRISVEVLAASKDSIDAVVIECSPFDAHLRVTMAKPLSHAPAAGTITDVVGTLTDYTLSPLVFTMTDGELEPSAKLHKK